MRIYSRPYVGRKKDGKKELFRSVDRPTEISHPQYISVVGPFRTTKAANEFVINPTLVSVAMAEKFIRNGDVAIKRALDSVSSKTTPIPVQTTNLFDEIMKQTKR